MKDEDKDARIQQLEHQLLQVTLENRAARTLREEIYLVMIKKISEDDLGGGQDIEDLANFAVAVTEVFMEKFEA